MVMIAIANIHAFKMRPVLEKNVYYLVSTNKAVKEDVTSQKLLEDILLCTFFIPISTLAVGDDVTSTLYVCKDSLYVFECFRYILSSGSKRSEISLNSTANNALRYFDVLKHILWMQYGFYTSFR